MSYTIRVSNEESDSVSTFYPFIYLMMGNISIVLKVPGATFKRTLRNYMLGTMAEHEKRRPCLKSEGIAGEEIRGE